MNRMFQDMLEELGIHLTDRMYRQFDSYYTLLAEWNKRMNLTSITACDEVYEKHFVDSLAIVKVFDINTAVKMIDIGTGAGFPGIPLKIAFPHLEITLLDSLNKRVKFLAAAADELGLQKVRIIHGRAEDMAKKGEFREKYDLAVSRAVANLASLSEYCIPFVKVGGFFISYKSGNITEELKNSEKAINVLGGKIDKVVKFHLPKTNISRSLVQIKKNGSTPRQYPRKAGIPTKEPIN